MRAIVIWTRPEDGGRKSTPTGYGPRPHTTDVLFCDGENPWPPATAWSLVVEKAADCENTHQWFADVRFLVEAAPHAELRPGRTFELYERAKYVAAGRLLGS